jgi:hypothetical protein
VPPEDPPSTLLKVRVPPLPTNPTTDIEDETMRTFAPPARVFPGDAALEKVNDGGDTEVPPLSFNTITP